ncbi:outer membrane beta-barrel protein [Myroides sp. LJL119]
MKLQIKPRVKITIKTQRVTQILCLFLLPLVLFSSYFATASVKEKQLEFSKPWFGNSSLTLENLENQYKVNSKPSLENFERDFRSISGFSNYYKSNLEVYFLWGPNLTSGLSHGFKNKAGSSFGIGANYSWEIDYDWKIISGLEFGLSHSKLQSKNYVGQNDYQDIEQEEFVFNYSSDLVKEKWTSSYLAIPILVEYQVFEPGVLFIRTGFKLGYNLSNKVKVTASNLNTSGYFPQYDTTFTEPLFAGFGDFGTISQTKHADKDFRFSYVLEVGSTLVIGNYTDLGIMLFWDLGLTNQGFSKADKKDVVSYQAQVNNAIELNSIYQVTNKKFKNSTIGIKIAYSFDF